MRSWIITLIIAASVQLVNAATLSEEIELALKHGEVSSFTTDIADYMGIERSLPYRALEVEEKVTFHDFNVVLKDKKPLCLILIVSSDTVTELHGTVFRSSLKGKLEKAFADFGRYDTDHHVIRGFGASTDLKLTSEVRAAFQRELDFWLKGLSRKAVSRAASGWPAGRATPGGKPLVVAGVLTTWEQGLGACGGIAMPADFEVANPVPNSLPLVEVTGAGSYQLAETTGASLLPTMSPIPEIELTVNVRAGEEIAGTFVIDATRLSG